ncbi:olfactory receptor 2A1/2A42-like [Phycodurus eques]|uniref:olfactory receptor 2A1/2A42-like n=1 Tax=Phycodurus eques TaxID=693459 RepID=UPI002ACE94D9|nr:olfactory receptor 2A1/2A42-like [Phycodurus eques]
MWNIPQVTWSTGSHSIPLQAKSKFTYLFFCIDYILSMTGIVKLLSQSCYLKYFWNVIGSHNEMTRFLPLDQVRMTHRFMLSLILSFWLLVAVATGLLTRLSFCKSVVINSYFCDHGQIYRLACNSHYPNYVVSCVYPAVIFWLPLAFILLSYAAIGCTLAKVAAVRDRLKAFRTSVAHLSLVAIYFIPLLITFTLMENIHPDGRIVILSLTSVFPPVLNPVIYTLQTQEIKESLSRLIRSTRHSKHVRPSKVVDGAPIGRAVTTPLTSDPTHEFSEMRSVARPILCDTRATRRRLNSIWEKVNNSSKKKLEAVYCHSQLKYTVKQNKNRDLHIVCLMPESPLA